MAKPLRPKRGTTAKNDAFTGLASEITIDTDKHSVRVHDGVTAGGHEILPKSKNDNLYAPKDLDVGVTSVNGETGDVTVDVGVTSVNGNTGDITPEQTGCLPLSGGTMTGAIRFDDGNVIYQTKDSEGINVYGGSDTWKGAGLQLFGMSSNGNEGHFQIYANNGSISSCLLGKPDGTLTWGGNSLLTKANNMVSVVASGSGKGTLNGSTVTVTGLTVNKPAILVLGNASSTTAYVSIQSGVDFAGASSTYDGFAFVKDSSTNITFVPTSSTVVLHFTSNSKGVTFDYKVYQ